MTPRRSPASYRALFAPVFLTAAVLLLTGLPALADSPSAPPVAVEIPNVRTPLPGVTSGGQPTEDELRQAAELGYRTVVSLRTAGEEIPFNEAELVTSLGMSYVSLPIPGAEGINADNAKALAKILDEAERPLVLHCGSGNRVGALFAIEAHDLGEKNAEEALQIGIDAGLTSLEPVVREKLGLPPADPPGE